MNHVATKTQQIPESVKLTPVNKSVKYQAANLNDAIVAAARLSLAGEVEMYITGTYRGYTIVTEKAKLPPMQNFFVVSGRTVTAYEVQFN